MKIEYADPRLMMVLKLFCGMLIFNRDARRHMRALYRDVGSGKYTPRLEKQEADLYMNPRRVRWCGVSQMPSPFVAGSIMAFARLNHTRISIFLLVSFSLRIALPTVRQR